MIKHETSHIREISHDIYDISLINFLSLFLNIMLTPVADRRHSRATRKYTWFVFVHYQLSVYVRVFQMLNQIIFNPLMPEIKVFSIQTFD